MFGQIVGAPALTRLHALRLQANTATARAVLFAENQLGARPSRANCSDHSAGASRNAATPMPLGNRPSTAALIRPGPMNASEIVMLTWRTVGRAAGESAVVVPGSDQRPTCVRLAADIGRRCIVLGVQ